MQRLIDSKETIDLNDVGSFASFSAVGTNDRGFVDVREYKDATLQLVTDVTATSAVVEVVYSLDGKTEVEFDTEDTLALNGTTGVLPLNILGVPFLRVQTRTAEGSAVTARAHLFLANLDIP